MNETDDQQGDQREDSPVAESQMPAAGPQVRVRASDHATEEAPNSTRRGTGRRVTLARQRNGGYSIWMMDRHIQSFCAEWEDITNFQLPNGIEQQIRIRIEVMGEAREIRPAYSGEAQGEDVAEVAEDTTEVAREEPRRADNDLIDMYRELPLHNREIIAGQIRENHRAVHGEALHNIAHPNRLVSGELSQESIDQMEVDLADPPDGWQDNALIYLRAEQDRIGDVINMIDRLRYISNPGQRG